MGLSIDVGKEIEQIYEESVKEIVESKLQDLNIDDVKIIAPVSEEEKKETLNEEITAFIGDEKNKQQAWVLAIDFERYVGQRWFTLDRVSMKTKLSNEVCFQKLKLLELFGYVVLDKGQGEKSKERGQWVFRITLTSQQKIEALQKVIETYREEIDKLEIQIRILSPLEPVLNNTPFSSNPADHPELFKV